MKPLEIPLPYWSFPKNNIKPDSTPLIFNPAATHSAPPGEYHIHRCQVIVLHSPRAPRIIQLEICLAFWPFLGVRIAFTRITSPHSLPPGVNGYKYPPVPSQIYPFFFVIITNNPSLLLHYYYCSTIFLLDAKIKPTYQNVPNREHPRSNH